MEQRADRILSELTSRYSLTERFKTQLRPALVTILTDEDLADQRTFLLEQVAVTCQRDLELRQAFESMRQALTKFVVNWQQLQPDARRGDGGVDEG